MIYISLYVTIISHEFPFVKHKSDKFITVVHVAYNSKNDLTRIFANKNVKSVDIF